MNLDQLLSPSATLICDQITSKKKMLEKISEVMAKAIEVPAKKIFDSLICREKLGTTALGDGVAIPHGRLAACQSATAVFILLETPIDYDAADGKPIDLVFAILVPEDAHDEHLHHLAEIAKILSNEELVAKLRHAHSDDILFELLECAAQQDI
ncbi:MAG: PTS sugar transporter subunit IIA [Kangiellaceae bacterium]|nr:PTS sugar transporter subunit IIA [Kangiellaceae bacterium]